MKYLVVILTSAVLVSCYQNTSLKTGLEGKTVPEFDLLLPDSTSIFNTKNTQKGKSVVLFYFGPHCPYSRAQINDIVSNISTLKNIQFYLFTNWPFKDMNEFYRDYKLDQYSNIITGQDYKNNFVNYFNAQGVPYIAVYGINRRLNRVFVGKTDIQQIKQVAEE